MSPKGTLTPLQRAHVAKVFPECREDMERYLRDGVEVGICLQREVGDSPPFAIYVAARQEFWIDCCASAALATKRAAVPGLRVKK